MVLLITVPRRDADVDQVLLNGSLTPSALELRVGERYRVRLVNIHPYRPSIIARLQRDSTPVSWRAVAKDGMDLPGDLRFVVTAGAGAPLVSMPVRVR